MRFLYKICYLLEPQDDFNVLTLKITDKQTQERFQGYLRAKIVNNLLLASIMSIFHVLMVLPDMFNCPPEARMLRWATQVNFIFIIATYIFHTRFPILLDLLGPLTLFFKGFFAVWLRYELIHLDYKMTIHP